MAQFGDARLYEDLCQQVEAQDGHHPSPFARMPAHPGEVRPVNILSPAAVAEVWHRYRPIYFEQVRIQRGGMANDVGYVDDDENPGVPTWLSKKSGGTAQLDLSPRGTPVAWSEMVNFWRGLRPDRVVGPDDPLRCTIDSMFQYKVNLYQLFWRIQHSARLLPEGCDIDHQGEAYHGVNHLPGYRPGWKIEKSTLGSTESNELRKHCSRYALMWRKPDYSLIPEAEVRSYTGPTLCPHSHCGSPCYGPYPVAVREKTFTTPKGKAKKRKAEEEKSTRGRGRGKQSLPSPETPPGPQFAAM